MPDPKWHEWHNKRAADFIDEIGGELVRNGGGYSNLMVLMESAILSAMLVNVRVFGLQPHVAAGLMEDCMQQALVRFTKQTGKADHA